MRLPENSLGAFRAAADAHIAWVELDVQSSLDGWPVVIHDEELDRTACSTGPVERHRAETLRRTRLRSDHRGAPSTWCVPVLHEQSDLAPFLAVRVGLLVEIKPNDAPRIVQRVIEALRPRPYPLALQSFDPRNIAHARRLCRAVPVALLAGNDREMRRAVAQTDYAVHARHELIEPEMVERLHAQSRTVGAWTVNTADAVRRMVAAGVDAIITDDPLMAIETIESGEAIPVDRTGG
jgi:glycerophosphoryl diester phosphodiesterase